MYHWEQNCNWENMYWIVHTDFFLLICNGKNEFLKKQERIYDAFSKFMTCGFLQKKNFIYLLLKCQCPMWCYLQMLLTKICFYIRFVCHGKAYNNNKVKCLTLKTVLHLLKIVLTFSKKLCAVIFWWYERMF